MMTSALKRKGLLSWKAQQRETGQMFPARLYLVAIAAFVGCIGLLSGGLLPTSQGNPSPPDPATRSAPKLILKSIDANPMLLSPAEMASLYDYVMLTPGNGAAVRQIKTLNPNVKVLAYRTLHVVHTWVENWPTIKGHESWFMHDPSGRRTMVDTDEYLMDIRNSEYRAYQIQYMVNLLNTYGFDGILWDGPPGTLSLLTLNPGPDPAAASTWHQDILTFLKELKQALGSKWVITNSTTTYDTGLRGADDTDYLQYVDGTEIEGFGHAPWNAAADTPSDWGWQQRMAQRNVSAGKTLLALGGLQLKGASADQVHQWQLFTYGSALLWADGVHVYYEWAPWGTSQAGIIFPEMTVPLGSPLGAAYSSGGVTQRDFTGGKVVANPSYSSLTVNLPAGLHTLDGSVNTQTNQHVPLAPWSALILFKQ